MNDEVENHIVNRFLELQKKKVVHENNRSPTVHVSDIVGDCMRKSWYKFHEDINVPLNARQISIFWAGTILHENAPLSKRNEVPLAGDIKNMKPIKAKDINEFNMFDCVTGTADDLVEFEGDLIIADKKTYDSKKKKLTEPDPDYVMQLNIYNLLMSIQDGVTAKYGALLYLDKSESFDKPRCFSFLLKPVEHVRDEVMRRLAQLKMLIPPERTVTWKCNWCPYKDEICHPEGVPRYGKKS